MNGGYGGVFELVPNNEGWNESVLYSFQSGHDGANPESGVIFDKRGDLLGTTLYGGSWGCRHVDYFGCGTVYRLRPEGDGSWKEIETGFDHGLYGAWPNELVLNNAGIIYGTGLLGGTTCAYAGCGTVFEVTP